MAVSAANHSDARGARIRRTALLLGLVAAAFYIGSLAILVWRGHS